MNKKNDLGPCILADKLTLFQPGGRLSPANCPPPLQFLDLAPYLYCIFAVLGIKTLKIHSFSNKASIAHLVERLASDLMVPGSIPGGGGSFFNKSKDNKITSCFSVGLYFTSYNPTEKWLQYHRIVLKDSKGLGNPSIPSSSSPTQETSGMWFPCPCFPLFHHYFYKKLSLYIKHSNTYFGNGI